MHQVVSKNGMLIRHASVELRQNRQLVLLAAKKDGGFLCDSNFQIFCNDREIALAASISSWGYLSCITNNFISDPEFLEGIISNAGNIKKVLQIPENLLFSNYGIFNLKNFTSCFLNLNSADKILLLIRLIKYDFLTKEVIEKLEIELINKSQKTDTIKLFLQYAKREGVHKF
jgi:hypothetical protein